MTIDNGHYYITTQNNALIVILRRQWDLVITKKFCVDCNQLINLELSGRWAMYADLSHWCLMTDEACDAFYQYHKNCISQGLKYQALLLPKSALKRWRIKAYVSDTFQVKTFLAQEPSLAYHWICSKGYNISMQQQQIVAI